MIDDGNTPLWPPEVTEKLRHFRQGSVIPSSPFTYHADATSPIWQATINAVPEDDPVLLVDLDPADCPPYAIVTSHSCDVDEEGANRKPWVMLAPVYRLPDDPRLGQIRAWQMAYLAPIPALGNDWVADLRIEFPVEKSWLVRHEPTDGYTTLEGFARFSRFCGDHRRRPALATSIWVKFIWDLRDRLVQLAKEDRALHGEFAKGVAHMYLAVNGDALIEPEVVQAIFVSDDPLPASVQNWLDAWWVDVLTKGPPFDILGNRYLTFEQVGFRELRAWHEIELARVASGS